MSIKVDARGLACPEPVIATKKALAEITDGVVTTIVDNETARENVTKFAVSSKCGVSVDKLGGHYYIQITKPADQDVKGEEPGSSVVYLFGGNTLGRGSEELGEILLKSFFFSLLETEPQPKTLLFLNSGVKLTVEGSPVLDHLGTLASRGVKILSCGTCLDYFALKESLAIGEVTNMYNILAELSKSGRAITL